MYANTNKQKLQDHLIAVGLLASDIILKQTGDIKLSKSAYVSGCLHDIGKLDSKFQNWVRTPKSTKNFFAKNPTHNELSLLYYDLLVNDNKALNKFQKKAIRHCIYWHHAKPYREKPFTTTGSINKKHKKDYTEDLKTFIDTITNIDKKVIPQAPTVKLKDFFGTSPDEDQDLNDLVLPKYKTYNEDNETYEDYQKDFRPNAKLNLVLSSVVSADRIVSAWSIEELNNCITQQQFPILEEETTLVEEINLSLNSFIEAFPDSERTLKQSEIARDLQSDSISVLSGPAGCGKTKIALEWAANTNVKKIIWIAPRVQICQGLLKDLTNEMYLPSSKIEILTGDIKQTSYRGTITETAEDNLFTGDIVLTTIDQILNTISTHKHITVLNTFMNSHVVFDEYHEYVSSKGFNIIFAELIQCKKLAKDPKTLLVSATINPDFTKDFLELEDIYYMPTFNKSLYKFDWEEFNEKSMEEDNPFYCTHPNNTFLISNTAITAQKSYFKNELKEKGLLLHSYYTKEDRLDMFTKTFKSFKEEGTQTYNILRAGPIVQASLNITCDNMITEMTSPENWLQRLGRLDRFGRNKTPNEYKTLISTNPKKGGNYRFLIELGIHNSSYNWYKFISEKLQGKTTNLQEVYDLYIEFYNDKGNLIEVRKDFLKLLTKSAKNLNDILNDPIKYRNKKGTKMLKTSSLRGNSRFVKMAIYKRTNKGVNLTGAYTENGQLTIESDKIKGRGKSDRNLLTFMFKKHFNIFKGRPDAIEKPYKDVVLLNEARKEETPIYTSYIDSDLEVVNATPHEHALYYLQGVKNPIGIINNNNIEEAIDITK